MEFEQSTSLCGSSAVVLLMGPVSDRELAIEASDLTTHCPLEMLGPDAE